MDPLQNAKYADDKANYTAYGYIHNMERKLKFGEVATLIIKIILGFYYHGEFIDKFSEKNFEISADKLTITNIKRVYHSQHIS